MVRLGPEGQPVSQIEIKEINFPVEFVNQIYGYDRIPDLVGMVIDGKEIDFREHFAGTIIGTYRDTAKKEGIEIPVKYPSIARVEEACNLRKDDVLRGDLAYQITNISYFKDEGYLKIGSHLQQLSVKRPYLNWSYRYSGKMDWWQRIDSDNFAMMVYKKPDPKLQNVRFTKVGFNDDMDFVNDTNMQVSRYARLMNVMFPK